MKENVEKLKLDLNKAQEEKESLRKKFFKELMIYKNAETARKTREVGGIRDSENRISVSFFDASDGLDPEIVEILNAKIRQVRSQAELTIARLSKSNSELSQ